VAGSGLAPSFPGIAPLALAESFQDVWGLCGDSGTLQGVGGLAKDAKTSAGCPMEAVNLCVNRPSAFRQKARHPAQSSDTAISMRPNRYIRRRRPTSRRNVVTSSRRPSHGHLDELVHFEPGFVEPPRDVLLALGFAHRDRRASAGQALRLSPVSAVLVLPPHGQLEAFAAPAADDIDAPSDSLSDRARAEPPSRAEL